MVETVLSAPATSGSRTSAKLRIQGEEFVLFVDAPDHGVDGNIDGFLCAVLPAAMDANAPLVVEAPVSPRLLASLPSIQRIYRRSKARFTEIPVRAEVRVDEEQGAAAGVGAFFSLGVDSFHTLHSQLGEITHVITVRGFDNKNLDPSTWDEIESDAEYVVSQLGKEPIRVESNLRELALGFGGWQMLFGAALMGIAHQLSHQLGRVYLSSSSTFPDLVPHGSHALLDPMFGTERMEVVNFGWLEPRTDKIRSISRYPDAMKTLRVCLYAVDGVRNCGRCEKCLRTMIALDAVGALTACETLPDHVPVEAVRRLDLQEHTKRHFARENLELLVKTGANPAVRRALQRALRRSEIASVVRSVLPDGATRFIRSARQSVRRLTPGRRKVEES